MGAADPYGYSKIHPPKSCIECKWHTMTLDPQFKNHTLYYDRCDNVRRYFGEMHIVLRGEYRQLKNHDEDDLRKALPYECPFYDQLHTFWEMFVMNKMDWELFIYECAMHPDDYRGYYVYALPDIIEKLQEEIPGTYGLIYLAVEEHDRAWFIETFGDRTVLCSKENPFTYVIPPIPPVDVED